MVAMDEVIVKAAFNEVALVKSHQEVVALIHAIDVVCTG